MMRNKKRYNSILAYLMLALSSFIFGFSFLFTKLTLTHLEIFQLLGNRFLIAAVIMTLLILVRAVKVNITAAKLKKLLAISALQPIIYFIGETFGVQMTSSSESGMMIALMPIAIALFSRAILNERLNIRQWVSVFISVAGVGLIVGAKGLSMGTGSMLGYLILLVAVTAEGAYSPFVRKYSLQCSPFETTFVMMWVGAIVFNAIGITKAGVAGSLGTYFTDIIKPGVFTGLLYLSILSSIIAFFFINYALSKVDASKSASFANLTTVVSVLAGTLIGGETILPLQIAGVVLIMLSIWGVLHTGKKPRGTQPGDRKPSKNTAQGGGFYPQV